MTLHPRFLFCRGTYILRKPFQDSAVLSCQPPFSVLGCTVGLGLVAHFMPSKIRSHQKVPGPYSKPTWPQALKECSGRSGVQALGSNRPWFRSHLGNRCGCNGGVTDLQISIGFWQVDTAFPSLKTDTAAHTQKLHLSHKCLVFAKRQRKEYRLDCWADGTWTQFLLGTGQLVQDRCLISVGWQWS